METPDIPEYLTKEHMESMEEIFGKNNLEIMSMPEEINEDYIKMMYPETQRDEGTKTNLVSYRPNWWNESAQEITKQNENWGGNF